MEKLVSMKKLVSLGLVFVLAAVFAISAFAAPADAEEIVPLSRGVTILLPAIQRLPV